MSPPRIAIFPDAKSLAKATAERFALALERATRKRGLFTVALSGGSTPKALYEVLARDYRNELDWRKTHFFWGDERNTPPNHADSNYRLAFETLLANLPIAPEQVHRIPTGPSHDARDAQAARYAAAVYDEMLREFFRVHPEAQEAFDLVLLGLGENGHTASLMPDAEPSPYLHDPMIRTLAVFVPHLQAMRITLTAEFINQAREVLFEVSGKKKAKILSQVLRAGSPSGAYPANHIAPVSGVLAWFVDEDAAQLIERPQAA